MDKIIVEPKNEKYMEAILIEPANENEKQKIENLLNELGVKNLSVSLSEEQKKYLAGLKMIEIANRHPKFDISDEDIAAMGKEIEEEVYGKYNQKDSN